MSIAISTAAPTAPVTTGNDKVVSQPQAAPTATPKIAAGSKSTPAAAPQDTVKISSAALALQEAVETPVQTAKEASGGDRVAQRLLVKESATQKT